MMKAQDDTNHLPQMQPFRFQRLPAEEQLRLTPSQESVEIREQLDRFTVLDWMRVQKIQRQMVAEEEISQLSRRPLAGEPYPTAL
jgi:hypothetical protein